MIHFFPYMQVQIDSSKSREDICTVLHSATDSRNFLLSTDAKYTGQVYPSHFKICPRKNDNRNYFLPVINSTITGTITEREEGCAIDVVMQVNIATRILYIFRIIFLIPVFLYEVFDLLVNGSGNLGFTVMFTIMLMVLLIVSEILMRLSFRNLGWEKMLEELKKLIC